MIGEAWKPLIDAELARLGLQPVETAPGDVILFDSFVLHALADDLTDRRRRALYLTCSRSPRCLLSRQVRLSRLGL